MLVILSTHPIQYQVPLYQAMAKTGGFDFEVWYLTRHGVEDSYDVQFGRAFKWDLNLLEGYNYKFIDANEGASPGRGFWNIRLGKHFVRLLREKKVTHLWINGWQVYAYWQAATLASRLGIKICLRGESNDLKPEQAWRWPIKKTLLKWYFKQFDSFLYIGKANKRLYQQYGIEEKYLLPGYYAVDNERFQETAQGFQPNRKAIRQQWNIVEDAKVILFSGKFIAKKRPIDIIKAAQILYTQGQKDIHLLFVGSGELFAELWRHGNVVFNGINGDLQIQDGPRISFTGFLNQTEISKAYVAADCLVLPSNYEETWGLVVNEALASGLPTVVSDQCGCSEDLILPYNPELQFKCGDIDLLVGALIQLFTHRELFVQRYKEALAEYNFDSSIKSLNNFINNH